jgi:hypothetical protein
VMFDEQDSTVKVNDLLDKVRMHEEAAGSD